MSGSQNNFKKVKQVVCAKYYIGLHRMFQTFALFVQTGRNPSVVSINSFISNTYKDAPFCLAAITFI